MKDFIDHNGVMWTGKQRLASLAKTKKAIRDGEIPDQHELGCNRCGQKDGIIHYHNHDYSHHAEHLEALCWRCHMVLHNEHRTPKKCEKYWEEIKAGKIYPAVYRGNAFYLLKKDHGI